jgi:hypothetical protein
MLSVQANYPTKAPPQAHPQPTLDPSHGKRSMNEAKLSRRSSHEGSSSAHSSSWDTNVFDEQMKEGKWKGETKKASRVQDLAMNLNSSHHPTEGGEKKSESWPFDSSPCRLFGGKNTKTSDHAMNKELFKTEFESKTVSDDDDELDTGLSTDDDGVSFGEDEIEVEEKELEVCEEADEEETETAEEPQPPVPTIEKAFKRGPKQRSSREMSSFNKSSRSVESTRSSESKESAGPRRRLKRSDSDRRLKKSSKSKDELGAASCHPKIESKGKRRSSRKSSPQTLAATVHGGDMPRKSRHLARVKSSDGLEDMRPPKDDNTGSFQGGDLIRATRSSRKGDRKSSTTTKTDRRARLTRAMSTANVQRPDEFSSSRSRDKDSDHYKNSNSEGTEVVTRQRTIAATPQDSTHSSSSKTRRAARPGLERKNSLRSMKSKDKDKYSQRSKSTSRARDESESEASMGEGLKKKAVSRSGKRPTNISETPEAPPRRDLMVLLRAQKKVQPADLMDKENRRLLHFLAYEHKIGINLKELRRSVSTDA